MSAAQEWAPGFRRRRPPAWGWSYRDDGQGGDGGRRGEHGRPHHGPSGPHRGRGGGFGGGFGGFGWEPFGRDPFRGGRRRRGKAARGDVRAAALALLAERPLHGYQIIQEITERSGGAWRPSPGSVYPALQQLADEGLVRVEDSDGRRVVHLTEAGESYVREHRDELDAVWAVAADDGDEDVRALHDLIRQVAFAAVQVNQAGDAAQVARAREVLQGARRSLYRILAEDEGPAAEPGE